ncbi:hypothetical protein ACLX1H_009069 [Fusarium chlamydosporum]
MSNEDTSQYPKRFKRSKGSNIEAVKNAIEHGLDPNILWTEKDLVDPVPKGGCVLPPYIADSQTWPHYNTPLHQAILSSDFDSAHYLLQNGADVNLYNSLGRTPLHEAVWNRNHEAIRLLVSYKADLNKITLEAHARALSTSDLESVQILVEAGVDLCPPSKHPWTLLDLALLAGDRRIAGFLRTQGVQLPTKEEFSFPNSDYRSLAQELLAFTKGKDIVPSKDFYDAYCFVLRRIDQTAAIDAKVLIQKFFEALHETADLQPSNSKHICPSCHKFQLGVRSIYETKEAFGLETHPTRQALESSAKKGCPLCAIVADALDLKERSNRTSEEQESPKDNFDKPVWLKTSTYSLSADSVHLSSLRVSCSDLSIDLDLAKVDDSLLSAVKDNDRADTSTGSECAIEVAKKWIQRCQTHEKHMACQEAWKNRPSKEILPGRLLHVGTSDSQPRLIEIQEPVPYCALSYCQGDKDFFTTTKGNLLQNMEGIPLESLSAVMRDAISVCRCLAHEYIWIDALCIVQNDEGDQAEQTAIINAIFSNAELTISTLVGSDCHTKLYQPRSVRMAHAVSLDIWEPKSTRRPNTSLSVIPEWLQGDMKIHGPVHSEGWKLAEQLLSTRILYFGDGMLHWECLHDYVVEADPGGNYRRCYNYRIDLDNRIHTKKAIQGVASLGKGPWKTIQEPFELWKQQVEDLTRRKLAKQSDRIPALDGISKRLANSAGRESFFGIWDGDKLLESLCWKVEKPLPNSVVKVPNMPSWTWGAVTGEVSYGLTDRVGRAGVQPKSGVTVVSINMEVKTPSITLKGILHQKKPLPSTILNGEDGNDFFFYMQSGHRKSLFLDYEMETLEGIYTFDVLVIPRGPPHEGYGYPRWPSGRPAVTLKLLIQKVENETDTFRRIGIGMISGKLRGGHDEGHSSDEGNGGEPQSPLEWMAIDEETFVEREFTLI